MGRLFALLAAALALQNPASPPSPVLRGVVLNEQRQPVSGAMVLLKSPGERAARSTLTGCGWHVYIAESDHRYRL